MAAKEIDYEELLAILKLVEASPDISVFRLKHGEAELEIRRQSEQLTGDSTLRAGHEAPRSQRPEAVVPATTELRPNAAEYRVGAVPPEGSIVVRSPMVGVFYRAATPGAKPFVDVGQHVSKDTTVCIIEVMKLMNSIPAERDGVVTQILVGNAEPVEFGQPLFVIQPE